MTTHIIDIVDQYISVSIHDNLETLHERLLELEPDTLFGLVNDLMENLPAPNSEKSNFNFVGDSSLSGLPIVCSHRECRFAKIKNIASFAAAYADQVILFNPFHYCSYIMIENKHSCELEHEEICFAIICIITLSSLIDRKIVTFMNYDPPHVCESCFSRILSEVCEIDDRNSIYDEVYKYLLNNMTLEYQFDQSRGKDHCVKIKAPNDIIEHGESFLHFQSRDRRLRKRKEARFSRDEVHNMGIIKPFVAMHTADIRAKSISADQNGINNIFSSAPEISVLNNIFSTPLVRGKLSIDLPYISSTKFRDILSIRDNEWHHFEDCRNHIFSLLNKDNIDEDDADEIFRTEILPELTKIERIIEKSRLSSNRSFIEGSIMSAFTISSTILSAGYSALIPLVTAALGTKHFSSEMIPAIRRKFLYPDEIRDNKYYYMWKIGKKIP